MKKHVFDFPRTIKKEIIRYLLELIGEDPEREGLIDTPERVIKMWDEIFRGYKPENKPKISVFSNGADGLVYDQMIVDTGDFYSHCEHHMVPFFGQYWFGYIPDPAGKIIGLSKVARLVDYHSAKLQIQERLVNDIVEDLWKALCPQEPHINPPLAMGLVMKGEHLCKTMRGARKKGQMTTIKLKGLFLTKPEAKSEFLSVIK
jgi:GTP cyclohydrolase IA